MGEPTEESEELRSYSISGWHPNQNPSGRASQLKEKFWPVETPEGRLVAASTLWRRLIEDQGGEGPCVPKRAPGSFRDVWRLPRFSLNIACLPLFNVRADTRVIKALVNI